MINIAEHLRLMLIENLASAASRRGGLDETEARKWADSQSNRLLESEDLGFDELERLMLQPLAADLQWIRSRLRL